MAGACVSMYTKWRVMPSEVGATPTFLLERAQFESKLRIEEELILLPNQRFIQVSGPARAGSISHLGPLRA